MGTERRPETSSAERGVTNDSASNSAPNVVLDPTKMKNQPALQTSTGLVWLVMGGIFAAVSLIPFVYFVFAGEGSVRGLAVAVTLVVLSLYAAMFVVRFTVRAGPTRLWGMAACLLAMAAVGLVGSWMSAAFAG